MVDLLPLDWQEVASTAQAPADLWSAVFAGGYPAIHAEQLPPPRDFDAEALGVFPDLIARADRANRCYWHSRSNWANWSYRCNWCNWFYNYTIRSLWSYNHC